jgi:hypothetical protein
MAETFDIKGEFTRQRLLKELRSIENDDFEVLQLEALEFIGTKFNQAKAKLKKASVTLEPLHIRELPDGPATIDDIANDGETIVDYADIFIQGKLVPLVLYRKKDPEFVPKPGYKTIRGAISTFGGPRDSGVGPDEGLALITPAMLSQFQEYFLADQPPGTTGLARRLNNLGSHYIACRWVATETPYDFLRKTKVLVSFGSKEFEAQPVDWGPNAKTGRIADLSDKLAADLGVETDKQVVTVKIPLFGGKPNLPAIAAISGAIPTGTSEAQHRYDTRSAANISTLQTDFGARVSQWLAECRNKGLNPLIHFGARTVAEQQVLFEKFQRGGPKAVQPQRSYHCYGRAIDWVNVSNPNSGEKGLAWDDEKAYAKGTKIAANFGLAGIGASDNDHLQDANFASASDLPHSEFGNFPKPALA